MSPSFPSFRVRALHLAVLVSFTMAIPLFSMLSDKAEFFVARHSQPADILSLVAVLCLLVPSVFIGVEGLAARLLPRAVPWVHLGLVGGLVCLFALPLLKQVALLSGIAQVAVAVAFGVAGAYLYHHLEPVRLLLTVLTPSLVVVPVAFLFFSPVSGLLWWHSSQVYLPEHVDKVPPIVMVVFDELPVASLMDDHGQIDAGRFPNFAALAHHSTWYRNATSVAMRTTVAIPALVSGCLPQRGKHQLPTAADHPRNLFSLLSGAYAMNVHEALTGLYPEGLSGGWETGETYRERMGLLMKDLWYVYLQFTVPRAFASSLPDVTTTWRNFAAVAFHEKIESGQRPGHDLEEDVRFDQFVESIQPTSRPLLSFHHCVMPHGGWRGGWHFLPSGRMYTVPDRQEGRDARVQGQPAAGTWSSNPWEAAQGFQRHQLQVVYVDRLLGRLIAHLKRTGQYNDTLLVITADHGITFEPGHPWRDGHADCAPEVMGVPLLIKAPYQYRGRISDRNVESIDVLPTVADLIGIRLPWTVDGASANDDTRPVRLAKHLDEEARTRDYESTLPAMYRVVKRRLDWLGHPRNVADLFRMGPRPEVLGRDVSAVSDATADLVVQPFVPPQGYTITPTFAASLVRARISRRDTSPVPDDLVVAVAVNGKVWATTRPVTYADGVALVSAMVPEDSLRADGPSTVDFYLVEDRGGKVVVELIPRQ